MFKSDEEIEALVGHKNNRAVIRILGNGQDDRADRTPKSETRERLSLETKTQIGVLAEILGVKGTAELTGKSRGVVGHIKNGENGIGKADPTLKAAIEDANSQVRTKALSKADQFLEMLGIERDLSDSVKIATVAEKVVNIFDKLAPKNPLANLQAANIVFYAPRQLDTRDYPVLEVEAQNG